MGKFKDLTGQRFGMLTVVGNYQRINNATYWNCKCDCGNVKEMQIAHVIYGTSKSCGCKMRDRDELFERKKNYFINKRFGRLLVISFDCNINGHYIFNCLCDCGNKTSVNSCHLKSGATKSCGCLHKEMTSKASSKHKMTKTSEYKTWSCMKNRCSNRKREDYKNYGGRGITHCERWEVFENFFEDMGAKPSKSYSLDRIDNNGNYCKENCSWATRKEQSNNKRNNRLFTLNGETLNMAQWAERNNIEPRLIRQRIDKLGWNEIKAITTPLRIKK